MKEIFKKLIIDFHQRDFTNIVERTYQIPLNTKKIISLLGVRRSGKTYMFYTLIKKLREY